MTYLSSKFRENTRSGGKTPILGKIFYKKAFSGHHIKCRAPKIINALIILSLKKNINIEIDLNSFIRNPSFSPKKILLSPNFRLPAFYLSPKYVIFMCAMYIVFCSRQWLLLYWQTQNKNFIVCQHVSST